MDYSLRIRSADKSAGDNQTYTVPCPVGEIKDADYRVEVLHSQTPVGFLIQVQIRSDALVRCMTTSQDGWFTLSQYRVNNGNYYYNTHSGMCYMNKSPTYIQIRLMNLATGAPQIVGLAMEFVFNFINIRTGETFQRKYNS